VVFRCGEAQMVGGSPIRLKLAADLAAGNYLITRGKIYNIRSSETGP
jgi:hypothetical protein